MEWLDRGAFLQPKYVSALRAGLSWGVVLVLCELGFGAVSYYLRPDLVDYMNRGDAASLFPMAAVWLAYLLLILAIYIACGMSAAKALSPLPLRSLEIGALGALAGAIAELLRSVIAALMSFAISMLFPLVKDGGFAVALESAGLRLVCGLPLFVIAAAFVAGLSAYGFSLIFFRPENAPK